MALADNNLYSISKGERFVGSGGKRIIDDTSTLTITEAAALIATKMAILSPNNIILTPNTVYLGKRIEKKKGEEKDLGTSTGGV